LGVRVVEGAASQPPSRRPGRSRRRCSPTGPRPRRSHRRPEERHYSVPALRWITTLFARQGLKADVARAAELLSQTAGTLGTAEAVAGLGHALGELALADGDAAGAVQQFTYALDRLGDLTVPYERAESELRAAVALAATGERELAIGHLTTAYRAARRLGARPLATAAAEKLAHLGEKVERRLGRRAAGELEHAGLSRREVEVLRLVSVGRTNREIAQGLFLSPAPSTCTSATS
jgi:hypothetical protein